MESQIAAWTSVGASIMMLLGIVVKFNHKRIRSKCCNKEVEVSLDVENTTPKKEEPLSISQPK
jgi:hypothetical protein